MLRSIPHSSKLIVNKIKVLVSIALDGSKKINNI